MPNTPVKILITNISGISSLDINSNPLFTTVQIAIMLQFKDTTKKPSYQYGPNALLP